jgi:uncharacterized protein YbaR (Trm112 family)
MTQSTSQPSDQVISPSLLAILVCPVDKEDVRVDGSALVCTSCGRRYPIVDGIPNMLIDEPS